MVSASRWSWVTQIVVMPSRSCRRRISICMRSRSCLSSAESGSSIRRMRGSKTMARASATRCCWPPESWSTRRSLVALRAAPGRARARTRSRDLGPRDARAASGDRRCSRRRSCAGTGRSSGTPCRCRACAAAGRTISVPPMRIEPPVGRDEAGDHHQQRRLAGARGSEQRHELAGVDRERHVVERADRAVLLADAADAHRQGAAAGIRAVGRRWSWRVSVRWKDEFGAASLLRCRPAAASPSLLHERVPRSCAFWPFSAQHGLSMITCCARFSGAVYAVLRSSPA